MALSPCILKLMPNPTHQTLNGPLVVALAYDGLCTFEFGIAVEVFGLARPEMGPDWYRFKVAAVEDGEISAAGGISVSVAHGLKTLRAADVIIIPGWRNIDADVPALLVQELQAAHQRGVRLVSFCSGVFVLAAAGLLNGRKATTHWRYTAALKTRYPEIDVLPHVLYVDETSLLTSAGTAAGIDLCLHIIRKDFGVKAATLVARRLVVPAHREGGQAQFIEQPVPRPHESHRLSPLFDYLRAHLKEAHTIQSLAAKAGMSERTFLRRFEGATGTTPAQWLLRLRLSKARDLLETTALTISEIADESGFGTVNTLRYHFGRELGTTPSAYRLGFRGTRGGKSEVQDTGVSEPSYA